MKMSKKIGSLRRSITPLLALVIVALLYHANRLPTLSTTEAAEMRARFKFTKFSIAELPDKIKLNRRVNPSLQHISAWISSVGAAVALADLDGDGLPNDLCSVDPRTDLVTIAPAPTTPARYSPFSLSPLPLPYDALTMAPMGCVPGDLNEDGLIDLLVYYWGRTPVAFLRQKPASQAGQSSLSGIDYVPCEISPVAERWYTNAACLADLDGDGHQDLIIGNYFQDGARILDSTATSADEMHDTKARSSNGGRKHLLLWAGAKGGSSPAVEYKDAIGVLNERVARGWTLAVGAADLDGDSLPEIYLANDFGPDRLLYNQSTPGNLKFTLLEGQRDIGTPASFVLGRDSFKGMGVDFADLNGDGLLDIYVSNITAPFGLQESHFLWLSTNKPELMKKGIAPYRQASEELGLSRSGWGWDCRLVDFDNDSVAEAIQATGFIKGRVNRWPELQSLGTANSQIMHNPMYWPGFKPGDELSGHEANPFFVRARDGRYYDISRELGLDEQVVSRAIAIADVDGDGRLDFAVANQWEPSSFYRNESQDVGAFLGLHLLLPSEASALKVRPGHPASDTPGRPAIGASATIHLDDGRQLMAQVDGGSGHSGKRSQELHFGLGHLPSSAQLQVDIRWRDAHGQIQQRTLSLSAGWYTILLN
jgi:hypothetical protein